MKKTLLLLVLMVALLLLLNGCKDKHNSGVTPVPLADLQNAFLYAPLHHDLSSGISNTMLESKLLGEQRIIGISES